NASGEDRRKRRDSRTNGHAVGAPRICAGGIGRGTWTERDRDRCHLPLRVRAHVGLAPVTHVAAMTGDLRSWRKEWRGLLDRDPFGRCRERYDRASALCSVASGTPVDRAMAR